MKPYVYLIGWKKHDLWYYGVSYKKNCHPSQLWETYFTSSSYVSETRMKFGEPDVVEIRRTFSSKEKACLWEEKVLRRMNVLKEDKWLNKNVSGAILLSKEDYKKIGLKTSKTRKKRNISPWNKGKTKYTDDRLLSASKSQSKPKSETHKMSLRKPKSDTSKMGKYERSASVKEKLSAAASNQKRVKVKCQHCSKDVIEWAITKHENNCHHNPVNIKECPVCKGLIIGKTITCGYSCQNKYRSMLKRKSF